MSKEHLHNHSLSATNLNRAFLLGIVLNLSFTIIEFGTGFYYNSLALISDAGHNLNDVGSLVLSLIAYKLAQIAGSKKFTYGYKKVTILASFTNAILLLLVVGGIIKEAIERFSNPTETHSLSIIIVATIGIFINTISAFLFFKNKGKDINIKGAFLHLIVDALVSVGVVISGIVIYYTGWNIVDPLTSLIIAAIIIFSTWGLLKESIRLSADAVPKDIDITKVKSNLLDIEGVNNVHHIHIWAISTTINAFTAHLILNDSFDLLKMSKVKKIIKDKLSQMNIQHSTIEYEILDEKCEEKDYE